MNAGLPSRKSSAAIDITGRAGGSGASSSRPRPAHAHAHGHGHGHGHGPVAAAPCSSQPFAAPQLLHRDSLDVPGSASRSGSYTMGHSPGSSVYSTPQQSLLDARSSFDSSHSFHMHRAQEGLSDGFEFLAPRSEPAFGFNDDYLYDPGHWSDTPVAEEAPRQHFQDTPHSLLVAGATGPDNTTSTEYLNEDLFGPVSPHGETDNYQHRGSPFPQLLHTTSASFPVTPSFQPVQSRRRASTTAIRSLQSSRHGLDQLRLPGDAFLEQSQPVDQASLGPHLGLPPAQATAQDIPQPRQLPIRPRADHRGSTSRTNSTTKISRTRGVASPTRHHAGNRRAMRTGPLSASSRREAAHMRIKGACQYCRDHKRKCDGSTPCGPCSAFHKSLLDNPCRGSMAENIPHVALIDDNKWCPKARTLQDFHITQDRVDTRSVCMVPVTLGFGSPMNVEVHIVKAFRLTDLIHEHVVIVNPKLPGEESALDRHKDVILPVVATAKFDFATATKEHIVRLVDNEFTEFKWYREHFNVLEKIYNLYLFYRHESNETQAADLLCNALSLLCLIHACDTITTIENPVVSEIVTEHFFKRFQPGPMVDTGLSNCFLRAQLGGVVPQLARDTMTSVLKSLFQLYATPKPEKLPLVIASNVLLSMTLESVIFRSKHLPLHQLLQPSATALEDISTEAEFARLPSIANCEACANLLYARYRDYLDQHGQSWLLDPQDIDTWNQTGVVDILRDVPNQFLTQVKELAVTSSQYLRDIVNARNKVLDRLTARLFRNS